MATSVVYIQAVKDLVELKKAVDGIELIQQSLTLYMQIKAYGAENVKCFYNRSGHRVEVKFEEMTEHERAISAFIVVIYSRFNDSNSGRMEEHYKLPAFIRLILGEMKIFRNVGVGTSLECINATDVIIDYIKSYKK